MNFEKITDCNSVYLFCSIKDYSCQCNFMKRKQIERKLKENVRISFISYIKRNFVFRFERIRSELSRITHVWTRLIASYLAPLNCFVYIRCHWVECASICTRGRNGTKKSARRPPEWRSYLRAILYFRSRVPKNKFRHLVFRSYSRFRA